MINQALPIEVQQEVEKERLSREKGLLRNFLCLLEHSFFLNEGTFSENFDDVSPSNLDGTSPTTSLISNPSLSSVATVPNSQSQSSAFCTAPKRSTKITNTDGSSSSTSLNSNSLVQQSTTTSTAAAAAARNNNKIQPSLTTTINGHDENSSTYKQQKKQSQKSSQPTTTNSQSRRQAKKQEQVQTVSRDSSSSYVNGFGTDNSDLDKTYILFQSLTKSKKKLSWFFL